MDTVGPTYVRHSFLKGIFYRAVNNAKIVVHGQKALQGYTEAGSQLGLYVQLADARKALGSVRRLCEAGNKVAFDDEGSYV